MNSHRNNVAQAMVMGQGVVIKLIKSVVTLCS